MRVNLPARRGSVLVVTLFILLVIGTIVGVLTAIIINQLRSVTNYSRSYVARAAAETGVERALYYAQLARVTKTLGAGETATLLSTLTGTLDNAATYTMAASADNELISTNLPTNATVQYDVFDEDTSSGTLELVGLTGLNSFGFDWNYDTACATTPQLEISVYRWEPSVWTDLSDPISFTTHYVVNCVPPTTTTGMACQYVLGASSSYLYRVRVKALNCDATVNFSAFDASNQAIDLHSQLDLGASGHFGAASNNIKAAALWHPPINDYLDYVIFSDEVLIK